MLYMGSYVLMLIQLGHLWYDCPVFTRSSGPDEADEIFYLTFAQKCLEK